MTLQGVAEESWSEVITGIEASAGISISAVDEDLVRVIRSASNAREYLAVLGDVLGLILKYHIWRDVNPKEVRQAGRP